MSLNTSKPETNPEVAFEKRDLSVRAVLGFLIALAIAGFLVHLGLWGAYRYLAGTAAQPSPTANPIATSARELRAVGGDPAAIFPNPRLQSNDTADMNKFRVREDEVLNTYGWVDQTNGKVHIPIEQAMAIVAQTGLPTRPQAKPVFPTPPGDSGAAGGINASSIPASTAPSQGPPPSADSALGGVGAEH